MITDDAWKGRIEDRLHAIAGTLGRIEQFMETSKVERTILFDKISNCNFDIGEIKYKGCSQRPNHDKLETVVIQHEQAFQRACGIAWLIGVGVPALSALFTWLGWNWKR